MLSFGNRLPTVLLTLSLIAGQAGAICAGWLPTAEARMACCSDDGPCPMHKGKSGHGSSTPVTQDEADRCCGASERDDSAPSPSSIAFSITLTAVVTPVASVLSAPDRRADIWRASAPVPGTRVPKHLLLSVFLV